MSDQKWFHRYKIAHRGLHDENKDENTAEAFQSAIDFDFAIECDVHLTADGRVVVHHDEDTCRMMDSCLVIERSLLTDLKKLKHLKSMKPMMTLEELLDLVSGQVPLLVEIKYNKNVGRDLDLAVGKILDQYDGEVAVQSFDPFSCYFFSQHFSHISRGLLLDHKYETIKNPLTKIFLKFALIIPFARPHFLSLYWQRKNDFFIKMIKKMSKLHFIAWTISSKAMMSDCKDFFETVIFDDIESVK